MTYRELINIIVVVMIAAIGLWLGSIIFRPSKVLVEGKWFRVGTKLTSTESGELIPASKKTPKEEIIGTVTKEGLIVK